MPIITPRLELVPATPETVRAALDDIPAMGRLLDAEVPRDWPPDLLDADALNWTLGWLSDPNNDRRWGMYWIVLKHPRALIGTAGFKGNPVDGVVEVGYGVVAGQQRRGYATEATQGLIDFAFSNGVKQVVAETYPELLASIGVMTRCGMRFIGDGSEPRVIRYGIDKL